MSVFTSEEAKPTHCTGFLLTHRLSVAFGLTLISAHRYRGGGSKRACLDSHHLPITSYCLFPSPLSSSPFCHPPSVKTTEMIRTKNNLSLHLIWSGQTNSFTRTQLRAQCRHINGKVEWTVMGEGWRKEDNDLAWQHCWNKCT